MSDTSGSRWEHRVRTALVIATVTLYTVLSPFGYAAFALFAVIPGIPAHFRARFLQGVMRRAFAFMHHWMRWFWIIDFDPRDVAPHIPPGPAVVIANHPTLTDTTAILGAIPRICTAVRADIFRRPWFKPLLANAGYFSAGGRGPLSSQGLVESAKQRLNAGFRVLIFPEGTRSKRGTIGHFGRSAFEVACRAGVPVLALTIFEEPAWLAPGDRLFGPPAHLPIKRLSVLGVFHPEDFNFDSRTMRTFVEDHYLAAQNAHVSQKAMDASSELPPTSPSSQRAA